jgi:hypothetical protein
LDISKPRLPSRKEYFELFLVAAFPVHIWAIFTFLRKLPVLVLPLNLYHVLGAAAYTLASALVESLVVFGLLCLLSILLPAPVFRSRLVPVGTAVILLASICAAFIHFHPVWRIQAIRYSLWAGGWVLIGIAASIPSVYWIGHSSRWQTALQSTAERLALLSQVYLIFDGLAMLLILFRNLT